MMFEPALWLCSRTLPGRAILQTCQSFAAITINPLANRPRPYNPRSIKRREPAILVDVHRSSRESLKPCNSSFLGLDRTDNLLKAHS
jgi:hypothetical protein